MASARRPRIAPVDHSCIAERRQAGKLLDHEAMARFPRGDEVLRLAKSGPNESLTALISLELRGLIREEFGAWHRL